MQSASPSDLICPNPTCQAVNPVGQSFCHACRTRLPHIVLYAPELENWSGPRGNALVGDRYAWHGKGVLVDHKPGLVPDAPDEIPVSIATYLRLFDHRPQVPIPYGQVLVDKRSRLLLEGAPVTLTGDHRLPSIRQEWSQATALRQLNWLYQIAQLWDPLKQLQCEKTLMDAHKLRVEGGWIRLLSLDYRPSDRPLRTVDLVREWVGWGDKANPSVITALKQLLGGLMGEDKSGSAIAQILQDWIIQWSAAQPPCQSIVAAHTDPGPSRDRNEDACYPESDQASTPPSDRTLAVVCDGLGGHDAGEVASLSAIKTFETQLGRLLKNPTLPPGATTASLLKQSFLDANHQISQRNDQEAREDRHRMGTTAVVTLQQGRLLHAASLGDSRIYRLTPTGCHQITSDDDLASREVRLGYGFYRDMSQSASGGALVQALGMGSSEYLSPGIRPLVLDENCLLLLCSDGVSDFDFVERHASDIYELFRQGLTLAQLAERIIQLANHVNGHDNATVALVYSRGHLDRHKEVQIPLTLPDSFMAAALDPPVEDSISPSSPAPSDTPDQPPVKPIAGRSPTTRLQTGSPSVSPPSRAPLPIAIALIAAGLLIALLWPTLRNL
ncbi:MAG: protein phosphatase 2C domain-containing protein, partial [Cyanobacteria bacterium P01_H01_bin.130]